MGRRFAECRDAGTRQRNSGGVSFNRKDEKKSKYSLASAASLALGKEVPLPSANFDTRQSIFIFFYFCFQIFSVAFIQYLEAHVPIWNFSMTFWYIFLIFYVYLNFSRKSKFELQVHEILEFSNSKNGIHVFECILRPCAGTFMKFRTSVLQNMITNLLKKCFLII